MGPPPPEVEGEPHPAGTPLAAAFVAIPPRAVVGVDLDLLLAHLTADGLVLGACLSAETDDVEAGRRLRGRDDPRAQLQQPLQVRRVTPGPNGQPVGELEDEHRGEHLLDTAGRNAEAAWAVA